MKKIIFIAILLGLGELSIAQSTISLQQAIDIATENNLQLKQGAAAGWR